jgi:hypothetical protein
VNETFIIGGYKLGTGAALGSSMGRTLGDQTVRPTAALQSGVLNKLTDPRHEAELRNIQAEAMLTDLMANDDVISGYDPAEVTRHYGEISQLSPRASTQSGLMRALLRKRLQQGAPDPFELDMLIRMENGLRQAGGASGSGGVLNGPAGVL